MEKEPPNSDGMESDGKKHLELVHSVEEIEVVRFEDGCFYSASTGLLTDEKGERIPSLMHRLGHWGELKKNE